ncbi:hypothetical protein Dvar_09150 [Desulfosarcina variabilis str. Montpellier]|uniref:hypothetical protein n=1 Tax=Desulfosarcina variabilis TaxID=2300 RepID=UPI003AFA1A58
MNETKRLWIILGAVIFSTLFVLGWFGRELYRNVPPTGCSGVGPSYIRNWRAFRPKIGPFLGLKSMFLGVKRAI